MANENESQNQNPTAEPGQDPNPAEPKGLDRLIARLPVPPKYRTRKWFFVGVGVVVLGMAFLYQSCDTSRASNDAAPAAPVPVSTPTPEPTAIPREEYQLPRQYAFVHFVNEMAACYDQHGQPADLETVEADIMHDVPTAVSTLLRLYADNRCEEVDPWHQIPGRAGWMLRASGIDEHLPQPEAQGEEAK